MTQIEFSRTHRPSRREFQAGLIGLLSGLMIGPRPALSKSGDGGAAPAGYPDLPKTGAAPADFVPGGWAIEREASGDVNGDGVPDAIFVIRERNPSHRSKPFGPEGSTFDSNPRILVVASGGGHGAPYRLALANHTLIPRHDSPTVEDPFGPESRGIDVARGAFSIGLHQFSTAGGWEMGNAKLTFRFSGERCELIGFDRMTVHRASGETVSVSANYLTGRLKRETGNIARDDTKVVWSNLPSRRRPTIEEVGDGLSFDPESR